MRRIVITILLLHACMWLYGQFKLHGHISNLSGNQRAVVNNPFLFGYDDDMDTPLTAAEDGSFCAVLPLDEEKFSG